MTVKTIDLKTTVRGLRIQAHEPDVRYRRYHVTYAHPDVREYGDAYLVDVPPRYRDESGAECDPGAEGARLTCAAGRRWVRPGEPFVQPDVRVSKRGFFCGLIGHLPVDDPEVRALRAELDALDRAWTEANTEALAEEDRRTEIVARAHAATDEFGRSVLPSPPIETECLECGAVYSEPGHVGAGGMACDRCGG